MIAKKNIFFCTAICILVFQTSLAQFYNLPGDYSFSLLTEKKLAIKDSAVHAGIKPYIHFFSDKYVHVPDSHRLFKYISDDAAIDLVFYKHLIAVEPKKENFKLRLDPVLNIEPGKDLAASGDKILYTNTRGFIASGYIGNNFYFETLLAENQSMFPYYIDLNVKSTSVVPGQGRWKAFKVTGYDYAFSSGFVSIQALKNLNIQLGHGKQKIGNGYRSLLLSDNAFNYPYARITQQWFKGRVQYNNIYAVLMNLEPAAAKQNPNTERLYQKKAAAFQYLSVNVTKSINVGFFQGLIWQAGDARNQQHLDWQYFNPVIYTNLLSYQLNNRNNILIGADLKIKLSNTFNVYGQLMADDLNNSLNKGNGWGIQGGFNYFNGFGVKNLFLQGEINFTSETSYLSPLGSATNQSYSHYNQNLASVPFGGKELLFMADYKWKRCFVNLKYNFQVYQNFYALNPYNTSLYSAKIGYLINEAYNLNIHIGINYRMQNFYTFNPSKKLETNYIYIGLKTNLYNLYYDF
ncbi:MAG: hypothetical protein V4635_15820 [Bacteroidota bacterium]